MTETVVAQDREEPVNILIVDDHVENRVALRAILSSPDYRVVEAGSGPEALRQLLESDFALLLIDVVLPEMDGFDLVGTIRQRPAAANIPIVFLTAQANDLTLVRRGYDAGAVDYLVKPLVPEAVRAKAAVFSEIYRQRKRIEHQARLLLNSAHKESELRLIELRMAGERRYRALADAVPTIIWTARTDGTIDYFNRRWFEYTALGGEKAIGSWEQVVHPDDKQRCHEAWQAARESIGMYEQECRLRRADGVYRWHLCRAVPDRENNGPPTSWLGTFTDIEDQKQTESALTELKETLDAVLDAVLIFEPGNGRFLYLNDGAELLFGYPREELSRLRPFDLLPEYDEDRFREMLGPLKEGGQNTVVMETRCRRKDGREVPIELSFQLIPIDSGHIVSIARDITDRKMAQLEREHLYNEALAAIRARDDFLSVASHELKTPLASLQLQVEMLLRTPRRPTQPPLTAEQIKPKLTVVERQIGKLSRLVAELMDVSRISAGKLVLERERIDLVAEARDAIDHLRENAASAGCTLTFTADGPLFGSWDRLRVGQIVTNLLGNALKYGAGKPVSVTVSQNGGLARLSVRDEGLGIAAEDFDRVFQRFERAVSARSYGGLGLGLYIVRQIVDAHGGTVRVESQPGAGSTFTVDLPTELPLKEPVEESPSEAVAIHETSSTDSAPRTNVGG